MKVTLNVLDRLTLQTLLPETGSFLFLKLVREAKEALSFNEDEILDWGLRQEGNQAFWNVNGEADIELSDTVCDMIKANLKELDKQEKLEERHVSLYEKFVL